MKRNRKELCELMARNNLKAADVAKLLECDANTVRVWRCNSGIAMPDLKFKLLKFMLGEKL